MSSDLPKVGVTLLICTYNGASRLPEAIKYIAAQQVSTHIPWEIVIVSNASQDNTLEVAAALARELEPFAPCRVLNEPNPGKENALIQGFSEAAYEFIAIVDDDNWLAPNYVAMVYDIMGAHPEIGVLGAHAEGEFEVPPPNWFEQFRAVFAVGPQNNGVSGPLPAYVGHIYGAGSVVRKSGWLKLMAHGFKFTTSAKRGKVLSGAEDVELGDALQLAGYKLWYDDQLRLKHFMFKERLTWAYLLRIGQGTASSQLTSVVYYFIFRHPNLTEDQFRRLYIKQIAWLTSQIIKQPTNLFNTLLRRNKETLTSNFEMLRLLYKLKTSVARHENAMHIFRQVRALQDRLSHSKAATLSESSSPK